MDGVDGGVHTPADAEIMEGGAPAGGAGRATEAVTADAADAAAKAGEEFHQARAMDEYDASSCRGPVSYPELSNVDYKHLDDKNIMLGSPGKWKHQQKLREFLQRFQDPTYKLSGAAYSDSREAVHRVYINGIGNGKRSEKLRKALDDAVGNAQVTLHGRSLYEALFHVMEHEPPAENFTNDSTHIAGYRLEAILTRLRDKSKPIDPELLDVIRHSARDWGDKYMHGSDVFVVLDKNKALLAKYNELTRLLDAHEVAHAHKKFGDSETEQESRLSGWQTADLSHVSNLHLQHMLRDLEALKVSMPSDARLVQISDAEDKIKEARAKYLRPDMLARVARANGTGGGVSSHKSDTDISRLLTQEVKKLTGDIGSKDPWFIPSNKTRQYAGILRELSENNLVDQDTIGRFSKALMPHAKVHEISIGTGTGADAATDFFTSFAILAS